MRPGCQRGLSPRTRSISVRCSNALSAVYTYHDPDYRNYSLGTASILRQIAIAKAAKKRWLYVGYRVVGCISSEYKARFKPHEILIGWPGADDEPEWRRVDRGA